MAVKVGLLGRLALQQGLITHEQLRQATREQGRHPDKRLGAILVALGFINEAQLGKLLAVQSRIEKKGGKRPRRETPVPAKRPIPDGVALAAIELKRVTKERDKEEPTPDPDACDDVAPRIGLGTRVKRRAAGAVPAITADEASAGEGRAKPVPMALPRGKKMPVTRSGAQPSDSDTTRWLHDILGDAVRGGASDVLLQPDRVARFRRYGTLHELTTGPISAAANEKLLADCFDARARDDFARDGQVTFAYDAGDVGRFRVSCYHALRGVTGVFHRVPAAPPTFDDLGLPSSIAKLTTFPDGMLLIAGPLACGKSFTLAALVNLINEERREHIITIADTIECVHSSRMALVSQVEVGTHAASAAQALRNAVREDSDIITVDQLAGRDTIAAAVSAADSGHLIIGVVPTMNAVPAVDWLLDAFPAAQQAQACNWVASSLKAILAQRLLPSADDRSGVLALEVLFVDDMVRKHIRTRQTAQIQKILLSGRSRGSRALDESLSRLVRSGHISFDVARANAVNPNTFRS